MSVLIAVLLAVRLASVANAQPPVRASSGELMRATASSAPTAGVSELNRQQPGGNRQDVLEKALLTVGGAAAAAFLGLAGYVIRRRLGFWLHRPQTPEDRAAEEHH